MRAREEMGKPYRGGLVLHRGDFDLGDLDGRLANDGLGAGNGL